MAFLRFALASEEDRTERTSLLSRIAGFSSSVTPAISHSRSSPELSSSSVSASNNAASFYGSTTISNARSDDRIVSRGDEDVVAPLGGDGTTSFGLGTDFVDVEGGEHQRNTHQGTNEGVFGFQTVHSGDANEQPQPQQQNQQRNVEEPQPTRADGTIGNITRRLRCLFSAITFPIVPLGTIVSLSLLWVLYAATSLDLRKSCSHPMHSYALVSLLLVAYIPNHSQIRSHIFHYSRERDGPIRPARVRMYDQFFHTVCMLYVYTGVTIVQTCRDDPVNPNNQSAFEEYAFLEQQQQQREIPLNTCEVTCPNLYQALSVYVATLELFTFALILPLLFLPCIYLWFLQRATAEADAFARLQDRLQEEDALLSNGGVTTGEILDNLEIVKIVSYKNTSNNDKTGLDATNASNDIRKDETSDTESEQLLQQQQQQKLYVLPANASPYSTKRIECDQKECCICMTPFDVQTIPKEGGGEETTTIPRSGIEANGENSSSPKNETTTDDGVDDERTSLLSKKFLEDTPPRTIVRTKCGHIFYKECLKGWVGGMWTASNANYHIDDNGDPDWRKRKARQIKCPLCREDMRPSASSNGI